MIWGQEMKSLLIFNENSASIKHLTLNDERIGKLISIVGEYSIELRQDYFSSLARTIIGQQLSFVVANRIWERLVSVVNVVNAENILKVEYKDLRKCGLSNSKSKYLKNLANAVYDEILDLTELQKLSNKEIMSKLTKIKGIGSWTSEIFLIFSLGRLDVLPYSDVAIKRAIKWLYKLKEIPSNNELDHYKMKWQPYCTVASYYLWEIINQNYISQNVDDIIN